MEFNVTWQAASRRMVTSCITKRTFIFLDNMKPKADSERGPTNNGAFFLVSTARHGTARHGTAGQWSGVCRSLQCEVPHTRVQSGDRTGHAICGHKCNYSSYLLCEFGIRDGRHQHKGLEPTDGHLWVCHRGILHNIPVTVLDIIHCTLLPVTENTNFRGWIVPPSSGRTYSLGANRASLCLRITKTSSLS
jgi:hypothetical protein